MRPIRGVKGLPCYPISAAFLKRSGCRLIEDWCGSHPANDSHEFIKCSFPDLRNLGSNDTHAPMRLRGQGGSGPSRSKAVPEKLVEVRLVSYTIVSALPLRDFFDDH